MDRRKARMSAERPSVPQMLRPVVSVRFGKPALQRRDPLSMSAMARPRRCQCA